MLWVWQIGMPFSTMVYQVTLQVYDSNFGGVRYHCGCGRFKYYCGPMRAAVGLSGWVVGDLRSTVGVSGNPVGISESLWVY